jgi:hypothetical protein
MNRTCQLLCQQPVDPPLARNSRLSRENLRNYIDMKVCLAPRSGPGMASMAVRLVADREPNRVQPGGELGVDAIGDAHDEETVKIPG